ncbi:urease accessory protein [Betaproteobacteria bacterium]|nr:urease accessory protein [Betaproteobacteria bacterium]GHT99570.1 urease accessory protein [Betaproteobacteria bacterium]GHU20985.1 urease accessory protein [Betaproteobacteria bacterium]
MIPDSHPVSARLPSVLVACVLLLGSSLASAHVGHDHGELGFLAGFFHPFSGLDHLAAMLAVGIWSAMTTRRFWVAPLSFASLLLVGAVLGVAGVAFPAVEPMIAVSLLVIGLLLAAQARLPALAGGSIVGLFAIFHGAAHGVELAEAGNIVAALAGMVLGTALIHLGGLGLGRALMRFSVTWARVVGGAVSALGLGLLAGLV